MRFVLDPLVYNHRLIDMHIDALFRIVYVDGNDRRRVEQAKEYILTHEEMWAPYLVFTQHFPRVEGNHRLRALRELGFVNIQISVPLEAKWLT